MTAGRTDLGNALRALLYQFGHVLPAGIGQIGRVSAVLDPEDGSLPLLMQDECRELLQQIDEKTARIDARTQKARLLAERTGLAKRLQTMPGLGHITALAFEASAPDKTPFRRGRDFSAWLGLCLDSIRPVANNDWAGLQKPDRQISGACV